MEAMVDWRCRSQPSGSVRSQDQEIGCGGVREMVVPKGPHTLFLVGGEGGGIRVVSCELFWGGGGGKRKNSCSDLWVSNDMAWALLLRRKVLAR